MSEETNNEETEAAKAPEAGNDSAAASADSAASGGDSAAGGTDSAAGDMATAATEANADAQGEDTPVQPAPPQIPVEPVIDAQGRSYATGRRKDASARVWVKRGSGHVKINGKDVRDYFARPVLQMILAQPFEAAERVGEFDVIATVKGGGPVGTGRRRAPRHQPRTDLLRARSSSGAKEGWVSHPRPACCRAQEIRQGEGAQKLPVLEALILRPVCMQVSAHTRPQNQKGDPRVALFRLCIWRR